MTMTFKDRLLAELSVEAAKVDWEPAPARRHLGRKVALVGAGMVVALAVAVPLLPDEPAFAVVKNTDGTVTVEINEFVQPKELEKKLGRAGVRAVIDYVPHGQTCREPRGEIVPRPERMPLRRDGDSMGFRVDPKEFAPDETLVVQMHSARGNPREGYGGSVGVIRGSVAPCVLVPEGLPLP